MSVTQITREQYRCMQRLKVASQQEVVSSVGDA